jgi:hypothetical protein
MTVKEDTKPWYRQVWLWLVLAPLITVVCVSAVLVTVAFRYSDDVVIDNYYKQGRMINQTLEQDRQAQAYGLAAHLRFDQTTGEVLVSLPAHEAVPEQLLLLLDHPFEADLDQKIVLQQLAAGRYRGDLDGELRFSWYLVLMPELDHNKRKEAQWILSGTIDFSQGDETDLKPRVSD